MLSRPAALLALLALLESALAFTGCQTNRQGADPGDISDLSVGPKIPADLTFTGCASADYQARQAPAAMMVVLDRSSSMADNGKWLTASHAIVEALDQDVFDSMWVGFYAAPSGSAAGPACIGGLPVACQAPAFPQIDLQPAGANKSTDPMGVRHDIKTWVANNQPDNGLGDASPLYAGIQAALLSLSEWKPDGKRILFVVTDGTLSCAQFSMRPGFGDCNGCDHDWEDPNNIADLLRKANQADKKPVESFVVGVPGADSYDPQGCGYPPYHMRLALSAIAYAGSPKNVPAGCDGTMFTRAGGDPKLSCHFDMTQGKFDSQTLADTISQIRGKVLGCVYDLPKPETGTVDRDRVNVEYTLGGGTTKLYRRKDKGNECKDAGCWDYNPDGKVELLGKACEDVKGARDVKVKIVVGCATVLG